MSKGHWQTFLLDKLADQFQVKMLNDTINRKRKEKSISGKRPVVQSVPKRRRLVPMPPDVSVNAKLCNVTGSNSGSLRGGKSIKASRAPSMFPSWYSIAALRFKLCVRPDAARDGGLPTL